MTYHTALFLLNKVDFFCTSNWIHYLKLACCLKAVAGPDQLASKADLSSYSQ